MICLLKGGEIELRKTLMEEMDYIKICIEQIRQDSLITSAVSSALIFIGFCWSEINAESTVRCKSWRLRHKTQLNKISIFPTTFSVLQPRQDHTNAVELIQPQMLLSGLTWVRTKAQALPGTQAGSWIGSSCLEKCRVREAPKNPQLARGGLLPILRPKIFLYFPTVLHYENFPQ